LRSSIVLTPISPEKAHQMAESGDAVLVDIREEYEVEMERLAGSIGRPLSRLAQGMPIDLPDDKPAIFLCASGARTHRNSAALAELAGGSGFALSGGILAWKRAGLPVEA
jgi:rhodanese-related sulfurtransferase